MKFLNLRHGTAAGLTIVFGLAVGCNPTTSKSSSALLSASVQAQTQPSGGNTPPPDNGTFQVIPAGAAFSLTGVLNTALNLGAKSDQAYTLHTGAFSGSIKLTIEHDEIDAVDTKSQVTFTVSPSVITVAPNSNYNFTVHTESTQAAPDFALHYHVVARESAGSVRKETSMETEFAVNPVFEIIVNPGNANNAVIWSTDLLNPATGIGTKQPASFIAHAGGVTIRFINMDLKPHTIHGSGLIPHQNTATPLRGLGVGAVNPAGKTYLDAYVVKVTSTAASASGGYYLHDGETSAKTGKITFNANAALVKPPVVDPTATFAKVNTTIFQTMCVSCHSSTNAQGGVDLSSYAGTLKTVVPYDSASSALYTSILANMPLGGTPLSSTNKDLLKNWIGNGALNN